MPAFDVTKIDESERLLLSSYENVPGAISIEALTDSRLPEMEAKYIDWIKKLWVESQRQQ